VLISPKLATEAALQGKPVTEHSTEHSIDYKSLTDGLRAIAQSAATVIMSHYVTEIVVDHKDDNSPVTIADKQGEEIILAGLQKLAPQIPIVSEEAASEGHIPDFGDRFFLVDPLDRRIYSQHRADRKRRAHRRRGLCPRHWAYVLCPRPFPSF
jgi:hypothetical protein